MKQKVLVWIVVIVIVLAVGIVSWSRGPRSSNDVKLESIVITQNQPYEIAVIPEQQKISVGDTVRLDIRTSKQGQLADIYEEDRVVHYVIASQNYNDFYHTFSPEEAGPGQFYLEHTFTQPGPYRVWTELVNTTRDRDLHHGTNADVISYVDIIVEGGAQLPRDESLFATGTKVPVGQYTVVIEPASHRAGTPSNFRIHVEDQQQKIVPVFSDEPAIYVMVGPDFSFFRHGHTPPAVETQYIEFTEEFPTPGEYLFWTEIYVLNGEVYDTLRVPLLLTVS